MPFLTAILRGYLDTISLDDDLRSVLLSSLGGKDDSPNKLYRMEREITRHPPLFDVRKCSQPRRAISATGSSRRDEIGKKRLPAAGISQKGTARSSRALFRPSSFSAVSSGR